jgi:soluble lytic murein transglycosylase-like protein
MFMTQRMKLTAIIAIVLASTVALTRLLSMGMQAYKKYTFVLPRIDEQVGSLSTNLEMRRYMDVVIQMSGTKLSSARKSHIIETYLRVADRIFDKDQKMAEQFAIVILNESAFNPDVKSSSAGAVGMAQLMPKYAVSFAEGCIEETIDPNKDLNDQEINITLGACLFKSLVKDYNNVALAAAAYNAGKASKQVKQLSKGIWIDNHETANYVAKLFVRAEEIKKVLAVSFEI